MVGLPNGNTTLSMCEHAASMGYECCPVLPEKLESCFHELSKQQASVPIAVEDAYSPEQLAHISRAVLVGRVCIVPVGEQADWETIIPLEMPELYALPVLPVNGVWYDGAGVTAPVIQASSNFPFCEVKGTVLFFGATKLEDPVADLNLHCTEFEPVAAVPKRKKKADTTLFLLLFLLGVVFLTVLGALTTLLLPNDELEYAASPEMQNPIEDAAVKEAENAQAEVNEESVDSSVNESDKQKAEPEIVDEGAALREHQEKACSVIDWKKARPGNEEYKQLQIGADLGCSQCAERLQAPIVSHKCPTNKNDSRYCYLLAEGEKAGCVTCAQKIKALMAANQPPAKPSVSAPQRGSRTHKRGGASKRANGKSSASAPPIKPKSEKKSEEKSEEKSEDIPLNHLNIPNTI